MRSNRRFTTAPLYALIGAGVIALGSAGIASAAHHEGDSGVSSETEVTSDIKDKPGLGDESMARDEMPAVAERSMTSDSAADGARAENDGEIPVDVKDKPGMGDESMMGDDDTG